jgi:trk/ktr system potassium uptake protein
MKILVAGAGNVGRYLARILVEAGHRVVVVDKDPARVARARDESGAALVEGDATEPSLLERNGVRSMDVVVATTGDDEDNLVVANLAKFEFGVARVVARVKNAANAWLYQPDLGVDVLVSAPHAISQLIEEQVAVGDVLQLLELAEGAAALVEVILPFGSPVAGKRPADVPWPPECVPAAILRQSGIVPLDTILAVGDRLICVTAVAQTERLHRLVSPDG